VLFSFGEYLLARLAEIDIFRVFDSDLKDCYFPYLNIKFYSFVKEGTLALK